MTQITNKYPEFRDNNIKLIRIKMPKNKRTQMKPTFKSKEFEYTVSKFPGGELNVKLPASGIGLNVVTLKGSITSSDSLIELALLVDAIRRVSFNPTISLILPYMPYARQDRVCNTGEALSIKVAADIINSLYLDEVITYDNHSDVATALLDNCTDVPIHKIQSLVDAIKESKYDYIVSPDAGAVKKIQKLAQVVNLPIIKADKVREVSTGEILATEIHTKDIENARVLIVDDICDGGRTFIELARVLRSSNVATVDLYVTHGIFSKGVQVLLDEGIENVITTTSIPKQDTTQLTVLEI